MSFLFGKSKKEEEPKSKLKPAQVLVIQQDRYNWYDLLGTQKLEDGRGIEVVQRGWDNVEVSADNWSTRVNKAVVHCAPSKNKGKIPDEPKTGCCTIIPDFVLVRNEVHTPHSDCRNQLIGLMFANVPSLNSLHSIYMFCDRPVIMAELNKLNQIHGEDFPLIPQEYYPSHRAMMYSYTFPCVVKVGYAHAGAGKMKIANHHDFEDFRSVMALSKDYCTGEPFLEGEYDLRIQKCGDVIRAFKRVSMNASWKTNTGTSHIEEVELTEEYVRWAKLASTMFGGLDICTVDAIHDKKTGKEYILEVNGTSSGWCPDYAEKDNLIVRDMVLARLNEIYRRRNAEN